VGLEPPSPTAGFVPACVVSCYDGVQGVCLNVFSLWYTSGKARAIARKCRHKFEDTEMYARYCMAHIIWTNIVAGSSNNYTDTIHGGN